MAWKSDKKWEEQKDALKISMSETNASDFIEAVETLREQSESGGDLNQHSTGEFVHRAFSSSLEKMTEEKGMLYPDVLSSLLVMFIDNWEFGDQLWEGMTFMEKSIVTMAIREFEESQAEAAAKESFGK